MKQSDLINLIGLKSTDQKLVDFFGGNWLFQVEIYRVTEEYL